MINCPYNSYSLGIYIIMSASKTLRLLARVGIRGLQPPNPRKGGGYNPLENIKNAWKLLENELFSKKIACGSAGLLSSFTMKFT